MTTAIYIRVSTERQEKEGVSLDTQKERLNAYCVAKAFGDVKEYMDVGSARTTKKRTNFNRMMDDVRNGFIKNIVIFKLDRLTRSIIDLNNLVGKLNEIGCHLHSCTENLDTTTASGRMMINLIGTFAQWESETISERVIVNMQTRAEDGIWQGKLPFGFDLGEDKHLKINKEEQAIFIEACEMILQGSAFSKAESAMNAKYNTNWQDSFFIRKIRAASTAGHIYRNEKITKNTHPPLINQKMLNKLLIIAEERSLSRSQTYSGDLFRQKLVCPTCGHKLSVIAAKSQKDGRNLYNYKCHKCYKENRVPFISSENILLDAFKEHIKSIHVSYTDQDTTKTETEKEAHKFRQLLVKLEQKKKRLQKAWIDGIMKDEEIIEHQNDIDQEVVSIENKLKKLDTPALSNDEVLSLQSTLKDNFGVMDDEERISFIQQFIRAIYVKRELIKGYKRKYKVDITGIDFY